MFRTGSLSPVELTRHFLDRIDALDATLNAFRTVCADRALDAARHAEAELAAGNDRGPLHGIPYVAKDLFDVAGLPTSAGTHLLEEEIKSEDSTVVARLNAAGMVLLGKTNTVQFAFGGAGVNNIHGTPHNPWHRTHHLPGGSSSGSGVAVSAGMAPVGLGTDTGGSVRIPASLCGITGLKSTVGRVSRAGIYPLSWTLDSVGPLARTVEDAALIYRAIRGVDPTDPSTHGHPPDGAPAGFEGSLQGLRIAFAESGFWDDADPQVVETVRSCRKIFEAGGATVDTIEFPEATLAYGLNPKGNVIAAEAYTVNRRFVEERFDELDPIVAARLQKGSEIPAHEYLQATLDRQQMLQQAERTFDDWDALLCPATMIPALPLADVQVDSDTYHAVNVQYLRNTAIGNILGLCGLSLPCGFTADGLPVGLMVYCRAFDEERLLEIGNAFQQATDLHEKTPELGWIAAD
jgi:aspartyl-tRNA(Asn)/glutamyl-tRNA(Gln) amidotransferase subunit A